MSTYTATNEADQNSAEDVVREDEADEYQDTSLQKSLGCAGGPNSGHEEVYGDATPYLETGCRYRPIVWHIKDTDNEKKNEHN